VQQPVAQRGRAAAVAALHGAAQDVGGDRQLAALQRDDRGQRGGGVGQQDGGCDRFQQARGPGQPRHGGRGRAGDGGEHAVGHERRGPAEQRGRAGVGGRGGDHPLGLGERARRDEGGHPQQGVGGGQAAVELGAGGQQAAVGEHRGGGVHGPDAVVVRPGAAARAVGEHRVGVAQRGVQVAGQRGDPGAAGGERAGRATGGDRPGQQVGRQGGGLGERLVGGGLQHRGDPGPTGAGAQQPAARGEHGAAAVQLDRGQPALQLAAAQHRCEPQEQRLDDRDQLAGLAQQAGGHGGLDGVIDTTATAVARGAAEEGAQHLAVQRGAQRHRLQHGVHAGLQRVDPVAQALGERRGDRDPVGAVEALGAARVEAPRLAQHVGDQVDQAGQPAGLLVHQRDHGLGGRAAEPLRDPLGHGGPVEVADHGHDPARAEAGGQRGERARARPRPVGQHQAGRRVGREPAQPVEVGVGEPVRVVDQHGRADRVGPGLRVAHDLDARLRVGGGQLVEQHRLAGATGADDRGRQRGGRVPRDPGGQRPAPGRPAVGPLRHRGRRRTPPLRHSPAPVPAARPSRGSVVGSGAAR
jgi:hypothetical protein